MWRGLVVAGMFAVAAPWASADEPDSSAVPARPRPAASAPT
jgi:hypothetical protein